MQAPSLPLPAWDDVAALPSEGWGTLSAFPFYSYPPRATVNSPCITTPSARVVSCIFDRSRARASARARPGRQPGVLRAYVRVHSGGGACMWHGMAWPVALPAFAALLDRSRHAGLYYVRSAAAAANQRRTTGPSNLAAAACGRMQQLLRRQSLYYEACRTINVHSTFTLTSKYCTGQRAPGSHCQPSLLVWSFSEACVSILMVTTHGVMMR